MEMLEFRKAQQSDVDILFRWANDQEARSNSFNNAEIPYNDHVQWFLSELKNKNSLILIFKSGNENIGVVRFAMKNDKWIISINLDKYQRGKGLAVPMLEMSSGHYFQHIGKLPVFAYIKKANLASKRVFEKAGFKYEKEILISQVESFEYKLIYNEDR